MKLDAHIAYLDPRFQTRAPTLTIFTFQFTRTKARLRNGSYQMDFFYASVGKMPAPLDLSHWYKLALRTSRLSHQ